MASASASALAGIGIGIGRLWHRRHQTANWFLWSLLNLGILNHFDLDNLGSSVTSTPHLSTT
jgi:hypothetical protein